MCIRDRFKAVHDRDKNTVLLLVGGGEADDTLKNQIRHKVKDLGLEDSVKFLGVREDVEKVVKAFDVLLLP